MKPGELAKRLQGADMERMRTQLMQRIVLTVEGQAKRNAPVRTGLLRRSITSRVEEAGARGVVGTNVSYARYVHDGTRYQQAQPFLTDALEASRDTIDELLQAAGEQLLAEIAG